MRKNPVEQLLSKRVKALEQKIEEKFENEEEE
jgi:hypothetical protein